MKYLKLFESYDMEPLKKIFYELQKTIEINYWLLNLDNIRFTYYTSMKNWSHQQALIINLDGIFLETYRISKKSLSVENRNELEKYLKRTFANDDVSYLIPIQEKELVKKSLTEIDRFKVIGSFDKLYNQPYMKNLSATFIGKRFDL